MSYRFTSNRGDSLRYRTVSGSYKRSDRPEENIDYVDNELTNTQVYNEPQKTTYLPVPGTEIKWRPATSWQTSATEFLWNKYHLDVDYGGGRIDTYHRTSAVLGNENPGFNYVGEYFSGRFPDWSSNDLFRAETECLQKLNGMKVQLGSNLLETKKTASTLATLVVSLADTLISIRRGRMPKWLREYLKRPGTNLSKYHLAWVYGIQPLIQDIYTGVNLLSEKAKAPQLLTAQRTIYSSDSDSVDGDLDFHVDRHCNYRTTSRITARLKDDYMSAFTRTAQEVGLLNPAGIIWESIPYSFLVDWVVPVGNVLDAMTATCGLDFVGGYRSRYAEGTRNEVFARTRYSWDHWHVQGTLKVNRKGFIRDPYLDFPKPMLYVKSPFSDAHSLNAVALIGSLLKSFR